MTFRRHTCNDDLLPSSDVCGELLHLTPERTADIAQLLDESWYPRSIHTEEHLRGYQPQLVAACRYVAQTQPKAGLPDHAPGVALLGAIDDILSTHGRIDAGCWLSLAEAIAGINHPAATHCLSRMVTSGNALPEDGPRTATAILRLQGMIWAHHPPETDPGSAIAVLNTWMRVAQGPPDPMTQRIRTGISLAVRHGLACGIPPDEPVLTRLDAWQVLDPQILAQAGQPFIDHAVDHLDTYGARWLAENQGGSPRS